MSGIDPKHISWPSDAMHPHNDIPLDKIQDMLHNGTCLFDVDRKNDYGF